MISKYLKSQQTTPYRVVSNYKPYLNDGQINGQLELVDNGLSAWLTTEANKDPRLRRGHESDYMVRSVPEFIKHFKETQDAWQQKRPPQIKRLGTNLMDAADVMKYITSKPNERHDGDGKQQDVFAVSHLWQGDFNYKTAKNLGTGAVNRFGIAGMTPSINPAGEKKGFTDEDWAGNPLVNFAPDQRYGDPNFMDLRDSRLIVPGLDVNSKQLNEHIADSRAVDYGHYTAADRVVNRFGRFYGMRGPAYMEFPNAGPGPHGLG